MPKFKALVTNQHNKRIYQSGQIVDFPELPNKHWVSLDKAPVEPVESQGDIEAIRAEFDALGAAYDKRWKIGRLKDELIKAKKEKGE